MRRSIRTRTYTLPAYWASALINGDYSGLEDGEEDEINAWLGDHPRLSCVDVGEPYLGRYDGLICDVATFTFLVG